MPASPSIAFRFYRNSDTTTLTLVQVGGGSTHRGLQTSDNQEAVSSVFRVPSAEAVWRTPGTKRDARGFSERNVWRTTDKWNHSASIDETKATIERRIAAVWSANSGAATATLLAAMDAELTKAGWL